MNRTFSPSGRTICVMILIAFLPLPLFSQEVKVGDTKSDVLKMLGVPKGGIIQGKTEILSYDRGEIILSEGKVEKLEWLPEGVTYSSIGKREIAVQAEQITNLTKIKTAQAEYEAQKARVEEEKTRQIDFDKRLSEANQEIDRLQQRIDDLESQNSNLMTQSNFLSWQLFYNPKPCPKPDPHHSPTNCIPSSVRQTAAK